MRILAVSGSPRGAQSQTLRLVRAVLAGAESEGAEAECVDLGHLKINYCIACGACYRSGHCIYDDDFGPLYARMLDSDGMVWGSPDYFRAVSAQMKTLIDRMADTIHCQLFTGKYGCAVASAGGPSCRETTDYIEQTLMGFGADSVGAVGASVSVEGAIEKAELTAWKLGCTLVQAIREKRAYPEQEAFHEQMRDRFRNLVTANKDAWTHEYDHWLDMGWL